MSQPATHVSIQHAPHPPRLPDLGLHPVPGRRVGRLGGKGALGGHRGPRPRAPRFGGGVHQAIGRATAVSDVSRPDGHGHEGGLRRRPHRDDLGVAADGGRGRGPRGSTVGRARHHRRRVLARSPGARHRRGGGQLAVDAHVSVVRERDRLCDAVGRWSPVRQQHLPLGVPHPPRCHDEHRSDHPPVRNGLWTTPFDRPIRSRDWGGRRCVDACPGRSPER